MSTSPTSRPTAAWVAAWSVCIGTLVVAAGMMTYISSHTLGTTLIVIGGAGIALGAVIGLFVDFQMSELEPTKDLWPLGPHTLSKEERQAAKARERVAHRIPQPRGAGESRKRTPVG
jgi:hypothetical protein